LVLEAQDVQVEKPAAGTAVAVFRGEHDLTSKDAVEALLGTLVEENELLVADFSHALFIDAAMLRVLRNAGHEAERQGHTFRLQLATAPIVRRVFEVSGILEELDVAATRDQALERGAR
jgi:anti-anti-sigma factor